MNCKFIKIFLLKENIKYKNFFYETMKILMKSEKMMKISENIKKL